MIKIDTSKIKNWEKIKELHSKWYWEQVEGKLDRTIKLLENINNEELLEFIETFKKDKAKEKLENYKKLLIKIKEEGNFFSVLKCDGLIEYAKNFEEIELKDLIDKMPKGLKNNIEKMLYKDIFDYDSFSKKSKGWNRHRLISMMGISVCPYCQRQYITNYKENDGDEEDNRTTADLDHFISKGKYPILALCLYNFIPSCQICNSRFKGQKDSYKDGNFQVLYPYEESYDDYGVKFKTSIGLLENIIGEDKEFEVKIDSFQLEENLKKSKEEEVLSVEKRITNDIDMFSLNKVYKDSHNGYLKNMLKTIEKTPESYLNMISDLFVDESEENKEKLKQSFQEIVKGPYKFKIRNGEPLGKLTKDIAEEFGIDMGEE